MPHAPDASAYDSPKTQIILTKDNLDLHRQNRFLRDVDIVIKLVACEGIRFSESPQRP